MLKSFAPTILVGSLGAALLSCSPKTDSGSPGGDVGVGSKGLIGATCLTTTNPFFIVIQKAMEDEAAKLGYDILYLSGDKKVSNQADQVRDFVTKGAVAIAINPCDSEAIGSVIEYANGEGVPVFTFDMKCSVEGPEVASHIGTDNVQAGQFAGEMLIEGIGEGGGKVAVLHFPQAESCVQRVKGFREAVEKHNTTNPSEQITVVTELDGGGEEELGRKAAEDALTANPDLVGIFCINDPSAMGAAVAIENAGKADQITLVSVDGQIDAKKAVMDGRIYGDSLQFPDEIGRQTVRTIAAFLNGDDVEAEIFIPSAKYLKADAEKDPELQ